MTKFNDTKFLSVHSRNKRLAQIRETDRSIAVKFIIYVHCNIQIVFIHKMLSLCTVEWLNFQVDDIKFIEGHAGTPIDHVLPSTNLSILVVK